ncbi:uncharacterized protein LOC126565654 isoform X1 [Anopheles maculipalpis]|uniref:uncharacterized protein LOC126565654 isoform X1 n=1 Tax=Anopheles maculipalpis TaxID=1496333 RepID=UPI002158A1FF|nr:uncharacterized protein LOC126565654 isoform X1 [Anopheles maculipalpis]
MGKVVGLVLSVVICLAIQLAAAKEKHIKYTEKDLLRKSIVYDKNTPDVFYCPVNKPTGMDKMIVRSRPLHKLCEHEGKPLPAHYKSDCYNDVDESNYACKEKYRIMKRFAKDNVEI